MSRKTEIYFLAEAICEGERRRGTSPELVRALGSLITYDAYSRRGGDDITSNDIIGAKAILKSSFDDDITAASRTYFRLSKGMQSEFSSETNYVAFVRGDLGLIKGR